MFKNLFFAFILMAIIHDPVLALEETLETPQPTVTAQTTKHSKISHKKLQTNKLLVAPKPAPVVAITEVKTPVVIPQSSAFFEIAMAIDIPAQNWQSAY